MQNAKIKAVFALTLLLFAVPLAAQRYFYEPEYALGVRAGATASFVSFVPAISDWQMLYGAQAGVAFRYITDRHFGIQVETNFTQRGWKEKNDAFAYERRLDYIEIPLLSHIYFGKKYFRWFFNLGPEISFRVHDNGAKTNITEDQKSPRHTDEFKTAFDYGIVVGTGFEFQTQKAGIYQLEARYSFGLGDLFKNSTSDTYSRSSNQNISLCFGFLFNIKRKMQPIY